MAQAGLDVCAALADSEVVLPGQRRPRAARRPRGARREGRRRRVAPLALTARHGVAIATPCLCVEVNLAQDGAAHVPVTERVALAAALR